MRYIINADDLGRTETVNQAIFECFERGLITNTTVMVNMPFFEQATQTAKKNDLISKVGLHINLTSGEPLTEPIKHRPNFTDENGNFNSRIFKKKRLMFFLSSADKRAVKCEVEAQIKRFFDAGYVLKHADSHGHVHTFFSLQKTIKKVLIANGIKSIRIPRNLCIGNNPIFKLYKKAMCRRFKKLSQSTDFFGSLTDVLNSPHNADKVTEIMLHPNYLDGQWTLGEPIADEILIDNTKNKIDFMSYIKERNNEDK